METINKLAEDYAASLIKVQERRKHWQLQSKPFLHKHLKEITEKTKLNWKAGSNETMQNLESVFIVFDHEPSGIVEQSQFSVAQKIKIGGFLSFSQTRNGQVIAWISFPFIDGMTEEKAKNEILETIEPEELTEESVNRFMHKFLGEMIQWENDARDEIGFVRHK
ncbi:hypothetical protein GFS24_15720 [Chitinophaga sp. SYP-B3965]|uniref:hypothetical protein n=1 Tax=Chitinophaga sp. SYP-B3965 TaxID=2663120 RepID=UPI001299E562|nr:hypothetical protein [Chitinophaga sp. SYP-B3965]MRG46571.1 hypothetical protein [Chitinophaga sp. SYP-B3965]